MCGSWGALRGVPLEALFQVESWGLPRRGEVGVRLPGPGIWKVE